ncbi:uncharacterized protein LOC116256774 [Nymphaea colorata]|nr:uncharacterized protein LOC116256774 [Nymphaea colorata]
MSLTGVRMSEEVWLTCLTHALSTEKEEVMGLLLGDIQYGRNGSATALIWGASPQPRSDRRKDRVETNPEQLAAASAQAERMSLATGKTTRVIGWYHSHPHITVLPSHVDVRTQGMYQLLDSGFIGLIFSCFSEDAQKVGRIQVIAFQSLDGKQKSFSRSQNPNPTSGGPIINVESSWSSSESLSSASASARDESAFQDTSDSRNVTRSAKGAGKNISPSDLEEFFAHADVNQAGRGKLKSEPLSPYTHNDTVQQTVDIDPMDMTAGMQEAMHRSNLDMSGAEYTRKEVPLQVVPSSSLLKLDSPLTSFIDMQTMLFEEEKTAYNQAVSQCKWDGKIHPLAFIHHTSTYHASLCKLMEYCLSPAIVSLQHQLKENDVRLSLLKEEAEALEIEALNRAGSPILSAAGSLTSGVRMLPSVGREQSASPERAANVRSPVGMTSSRSRRGY